MSFSPTVFRAYDLRGIFNQDFSAEDFSVLAVAIVRWFRGRYGRVPRVLWSHDARLSSPMLAEAFFSGLSHELSAEKMVYAGALPTPLNLWAGRGFDLCLQITASHNPPEYNGLKLHGPEGSIAGDDWEEIQAQFSAEKIERSLLPTPVFQLADYIEALRTQEPSATNKTPLIIDAGSGIAGAFYPMVFEALGYAVQRLYCEPDGNFPHHQPDPEDPENLRDLQAVIQNAPQTSWGLAFDGDGDRLGAVSPEGIIFSAEKILAVLAIDLLTRCPRSAIVVDIMTSPRLIDFLQSQGATVHLSPTGHSHISRVMKEHQALLGGEQSGHIMLAERWDGTDDACLAGVRFLRAIENSQNPLITEISQWEELPTWQHKITVSETAKTAITQQMVATLQQQIGAGLTLDGWRYQWSAEDWVVVRASNTSPKIVIRLQSRQRLAHYQALLKRVLGLEKGSEES